MLAWVLLRSGFLRSDAANSGPNWSMSILALSAKSDLILGGRWVGSLLRWLFWRARLLNAELPALSGNRHSVSGKGFLHFALLSSWTIAHQKTSCRIHSCRRRMWFFIFFLIPFFNWNLIWVSLGLFKNAFFFWQIIIGDGVFHVRRDALLPWRYGRDRIWIDYGSCWPNVGIDESRV